MRCRVLLFALIGLVYATTTAFGQTASMTQFDASPPDLQDLPGISGAITPCVGGTAGGYACNEVDLLAFIPNSTFGAGAANDIWGWTDPQTANEYAIIGLNNGTAFVDVSDPENPVYLGKLPTHTFSSSWRDIKVYDDHAFIVSEASGHGVQVFDLTLLRQVINPPNTFLETAHYAGVNDVHNIAINEDSGYAYTVGNNGGGQTCAGGLHMIDISTPTAPTFAGCYSGDGYTHDAQCVNYNGPDAQHVGKEICFNSNEDTVTIVDVSDKSNPVQLSRTGYPNAAYVHQGWLTDDQATFYQNDELDSGPTRTLVWDVTDLDNPVVATQYMAATTSRDHNLYTVGDLVYEANYTTGLRVLDITDRVNPVEVAFFDTYTPNNGTSFSGAWSNYPYFDSGIVVVSSIGEGLFVLRPNVGGGGAAFGITLKKLIRTAGGTKKAKIKWNSTDINKGKVDFYVDRSPDGNPDKRTRNDGAVKLKITFPGNGPFNITACEKNSTTFCSNTLTADFTGVSVSLNEPEEDDETDGFAAKGAATDETPPAFALRGNYPNPFNPVTSIRLDLPEAAQVQVSVFDLLGRQVLTPAAVWLSAGSSRSVAVDASSLPSGTYVYRVTARMAETVEVGTGRMVLLK